MTEPKKSIADTLNVTPYDEGVAANLDRAADAVPVAGKAWESGKSVHGHLQELGDADGAGELAASALDLLGDAGSFVAGAGADVFTFTMDPVGWLVSNGLTMLLELVQPLQDALHHVTGDGPAIGHAAGEFAEIAQGFVALADDFAATGDTALKDWREEAGDAARAALADFAVGVKGIGSCAGSVADVLRMWSIVMQVVEEVVKAVISELVSWMITVWLPALATSVISLGGSVAAAMTATVAKAASAFKKVSHHLGVLGKLLDKFMQFLVDWSRKLDRFAFRFRIGNVVQKGERPFYVFGDVASRNIIIPSRRVVTTAFGTAAGAAPLVTGMGIKAGVPSGKSSTPRSKTRPSAKGRSSPRARPAAGRGWIPLVGTSTCEAGVREADRR